MFRNNSPVREPNKAKRTLTGLTLFEALLVTAVIGIVLVLSIPHLSRMKIQANETDAIASLGKIAAAMEVYRILYKTYPDNLNKLSIVNPTLSAGPLLSSGSKSGYNYRIEIEDESFDPNSFTVIAEPKQPLKTGEHRFKVDQNGIIYSTDSQTSIVWMPLGGAI
ncbi:MAG: hypothetical protein KJ593_04085 [Candidatus Omnitrophica bacterium]|nr:hypothetical protein [Candidatus Omnitrophota bacterium]